MFDYTRPSFILTNPNIISSKDLAIFRIQHDL